MEQILDSYLVESEFEKVRQFNHSPGQFDFEKHIRDSIVSFKAKHEKIVTERKVQAQTFLGA